MGLTKTSYTVSGTSGLKRYLYDAANAKITGDLPNTWDVGGVKTFINCNKSMEEYLGRQKLCMIPITTDSSGASSVSFSCTGDYDGFSGIYWKIQSSWSYPAVNSSYTLSGGTRTTQSNYNGAGVSGMTYSGTISINLLPNTTYYVVFYAIQGSHSYNYSTRMYNTMTITAAGAYGTKGTVTTNKNSMNFGDSITISYASPNHVSGSTTYVVTAKVGTSTAETLQSGGGTSSTSWTPDLATYASSYPNQASVSCVITATTYFGATSVGSTTKTITINFTSAQVGPSLATGAFSIAPRNTGAVAGMTGYIQGYSLIRASFDSSKVTKQYGATVSKWTVKFGSASAVDVAAGTSTKDSSAVTGTAAITVVCTVVDSRGFTASQSFSATITPYASPTLVCSIERTEHVTGVDGNGNDVVDRNYVKITFSARYASVDGQNSVTVEVFAKTAAAQSYTSRGTILDGTTTTSGTDKIYSKTNHLLDNFSMNNTWDIMVKVTDALGNEETYSDKALSEAWALHFRNYGAGAAFGKAAETDKQLQIPDDWDYYTGLELVLATKSQTMTSTQKNRVKTNLGIS